MLHSKYSFNCKSQRWSYLTVGCHCTYNRSFEPPSKTFEKLLVVDVPIISCLLGWKNPVKSKRSAASSYYNFYACAEWTNNTRYPACSIGWLCPEWVIYNNLLVFVVFRVLAVWAPYYSRPTFTSCNETFYVRLLSTKTTLAKYWLF